MDNALHRHDISDDSWELIAPHLPGKTGDWSGFARDNRLFINAVICLFAHRRALAGLASGIRRMEKHA